MLELAEADLARASELILSVCQITDAGIGEVGGNFNHNLKLFPPPTFANLDILRNIGNRTMPLWLGVRV